MLPYLVSAIGSNLLSFYIQIFNLNIKIQHKEYIRMSKTKLISWVSHLSGSWDNQIQWSLGKVHFRSKIMEHLSIDEVEHFWCTSIL